MISLDNALGILCEEKISVETEYVDLKDCCNRFLAEEICSVMDSPPFDKSAMDGVAVVASDNREGAVLKLEGVTGAGDSDFAEITAGMCRGVMTGAAIPAGCDFIIRKEFLEYEGDSVKVIQKEKYDNIIRKGENIQKGDTLLKPCRITPAVTGILASNGVSEVSVYKKIKIGIINTGSEIVEPGSVLEPGQIYNSTGTQLTTQIEKYGCEAVYYGIAGDNPDILYESIEQAFKECNLVVLSGGVSLGDYDYVPQMLEKLGVEKLFHHVRIKPGKPTYFGKKDGVYFLGLPGNPVSSYVIFEVFGLSLVFNSYGISEPVHKIAAVEMADAFKRRNTERTEFRPVKMVGGKIKMISYHGSSHLNALAEMDGVIKIEAGEDSIAAGEMVNVRFI
jgi:molybdopterin molybdotransferase